MNILVIEDNPDHYSIIEDSLTEGIPEKVNIQHEVELSKGLHQLSKKRFDICLCDLQLPDAPINTTSERLKTLNSQTPIIVLTSLNSNHIAQQLLKHGIQDYLPKEDLMPELLHRMCLYAIERKQKELKLKKQNQDMQTFCASLSHDFKGNLRRIPQIADILKEKLSERIEINEEELNWFHLLSSSAEGINNLVENLSKFLSVNHSANDYFEAVDLFKVVARVVDIITDNGDRTATINVTTELPDILGDESQLLLLFHNLISNGIKYNKNSPLIEIKASPLIENFCEITVSDNGIGIDPKHFDKIFSPFKRLHGQQEYSGTGLGLSIVQGIIDNHGGSIRVESTPGEGSRFIMKLPLANQGALYQ